MNYKKRTDLTFSEKIYWYLRFFIETDKGALYKNKAKLRELCDSLGVALTSGGSFSEEEHVEIMRNIVISVILSASKEGTQQHIKLQTLSGSLEEIMLQTEDFTTLVFCLEKLLIPSNQALENVPTTEVSKIAMSYAKAVLDEKGPLGLANILMEWDSITLELCLNRERDIAANLFLEVRLQLEDESVFNNLQVKAPSKPQKTPNDSDIILSAVIQEFERRLGQKRKQRSGQDLESATTFIFNYYGIKCAEKPSHFNADIEIDNWVKDKKGWYLGFSLKRTLRERWKQTVTDKDTLTEFRIRHIIHLICHDSDLTDSKIGNMGAKRHLFFVPDDSKVLMRVKNDNVLSEFVKPMSQLINYITNV
jgi:hypothetical protein